MRKFALVICTYMRPEALLKLLTSVKSQVLYPDRILIVDGSTNHKTKECLEKNTFKNLEYYLVNQEHRGLTKQRNFGVKNLPQDIDIVCFLDDDIILTKTYFKELLNTYTEKPDAIGVGGYITNEVTWQISENQVCHASKYCIDGWQRNEPLKFRIRKTLGLLPETPPGVINPFSHGRSISFLPPNNNIYSVEQFMGGVSSYKVDVFKKIEFSPYFEGYGLYEDVDFCVRLLRHGKLYVNTGATLGHYHEASGRPNKFKYGKMVSRNGWYVWRLKNKTPSLTHKFKWYAVSSLQIALRILNIFNTSKRFEALTEALGRTYGMLGLFVNKPKVIDAQKDY